MFSVVHLAPVPASLPTPPHTHVLEPTCTHKSGHTQIPHINQVSSVLGPRIAGLRSQTTWISVAIVMSSLLYLPFTLLNIRGHHTVKLICTNLAYFVFIFKSYEYSNIRLEETTMGCLIIQSLKDNYTVFSFLMWTVLYFK